MCKPELSDDVIRYFCTDFIGLVITVIVTLFVLVKQLRANQKTENYKNQLKLKDMFLKKERWEVYVNFQSNKYETNQCPTKEEMCKVYDYLGLFELAYKMMKSKEMTKDEFFNTYYYRILNFAQTSFIKDIVKKESQYWKVLISLIVEGFDWGIKNKRSNKSEIFDDLVFYRQLQK